MNWRAIHVATIVAVIVTLLLGMLVAIEDHEVWGVAQFTGYTFFTSALGAVFARSIRKLIEE